ncbi:MAG TPA: S8 family serine peptidase [Bdellovibrionota bacterium]|nr:S8 family serine peptidase [Bdellovibrionota bacterium]
MSSSVRALALLIAFAFISGANASEYKSGEVIVKYKDGAIRARSVMNMMYNDLGVKSVRRSGFPKGFEHLILKDTVKVEDAIAELQRNGLVEYAQPNYILSIYPTSTLEDPPIPGFPGGGGGIPCIPGMDIPGCDPNAEIPGLPGGGGGGGGGGGVPCLIPGIPFPPGCEDSGTPGNPPGDPGTPPSDPGTPTNPPANKPALQPAPAEVNPPVVDPDLDKAYGLEKIGARKAWAEWQGSKEFIVADIDTGIDYNHEDLSFNVWRNPTPSEKNDVAGFDFVHNDGLPYDDNQHGTHTSGTIGGVGGNGKGVSGVAPRVSIMGLKFLSGEGSGTTADAIRAIDYAIEHGAKVISASWGGPGDDGNKALYDSIERAKAKDVLFVAAAGNESKNNDIPSQASYPAAFDNDNLIAVAATDKNDSMAFFSNYGEKTVHVAAPGANVYSLIPGNKYAAFSGTSMACPHVAGAAALLWSKNPTWNYKKVKQVLMDTSDKLSSLKGKTISGGRINVLNALHSTD